MWKPMLAISIGSAAGGLSRWWLGIKLNAIFPTLPPGTFAANVIAGYIIGAAVAVFTRFPGLAPEWRLLIITGFCGGLSTFSTFSSEVVALAQRGQLAWAAGEVSIHVAGSLAATLAGIASVQWLRSS
ncbi:MAG: fluoride efflux transporter CrcB [Bordetella sp.]|uniref:fluoride efflux transporter CrcB n=1 Tax=Bordetella sp. TaxID=28081 RepID=UPI003F7B7865